MSRHEQYGVAGIGRPSGHDPAPGFATRTQPLNALALKVQVTMCSSRFSPLRVSTWCMVHGAWEMAPCLLRAHDLLCVCAKLMLLATDGR